MLKKYSVTLLVLLNMLFATGCSRQNNNLKQVN